MTLPFHTYANLFPLIDGVEFADLVADLKANGLHDPIVIYDGSVLDGRNRARACEAAEVDPVYHPFLGTDAEALAYVISKNLKRRHLNESQRAFVAAKLANLGEGRPAETAEISAVSQPQAGAMLNVSRGSVQNAAVVLKHASEDVQRAVERGDLPVSTAAKVAALPEAEQRAIVEKAEGGDIAIIARNEVKRLARADREDDLAEKQRALPQKRYGVIYADPEWRFEPYSRNTGMDRAADNHYPTSATDAICQRPVKDIAADDAALFLWATVPMLPDALKVMAAWGFDYKSHCIWIKDRVGTGYWFRNAHELLLIGTHGDIPAPAPGTQWPSTAMSPVGRHSEKPEIFYELIEEYFPNLPKIELNARVARPGWDRWGNEAPADQAEPVEASAPLVEQDKSNVVTKTESPQPDHRLDIPSFLRRNPDNSLPVSVASSVPAHAATGEGDGPSVG